MSKQKEIREGIKTLIPFLDCDRCINRTCVKRPPFCKEEDEAVGEILHYLHSQGVVILEEQIQRYSEQSGSAIEPIPYKILTSLLKEE